LGAPTERPQSKPRHTISNQTRELQFEESSLEGSLW
jgi:hypothetical protein